MDVKCKCQYLRRLFDMKIPKLVSTACILHYTETKLKEFSLKVKYLNSSFSHIFRYEWKFNTITHAILYGM